MAEGLGQSKEYFESFSRKTGFHRDTLEKVYRLLDLLKEINNHPQLKNSLVLKGGTAINFIYFEFPRLSVDIDFNFIGGIAKEAKDIERVKTEKSLEDIFVFKKYRFMPEAGYGSQKYYLEYINSSGNKDRIKVEINFLHRLPLLGTIKQKLVTPFPGVKIKATVLKTEELFAGKSVALMDRLATRDLYDIYNLKKKWISINKIILRKLFIFYGCLSRKDFRQYKPTDIDRITRQDIKEDLWPLLRKSELPDLKEMLDSVKPFLTQLFKYQPEEKEYIENFFRGEFKPGLLFGILLEVKNLGKHPMVMWKQTHIKEWLKKQHNKSRQIL